MPKNYDLACNDIAALVAFLRRSANNGRFPQELVERYSVGGDIGVAINAFLAQSPGVAAVYVACDSYAKVYGVSLIKVASNKGIVPSFMSEAEVFIGDRGGIDEFVMRVWARKSVGGLFRRAKTRMRCRKYTPSSEYVDYLARLAREVQRDQKDAEETAAYNAEMAAAGYGPNPGMVQL